MMVNMPKNAAAAMTASTLFESTMLAAYSFFYKNSSSDFKNGSKQFAFLATYSYGALYDFKANMSLLVIST